MSTKTNAGRRIGVPVLLGVIMLWTLVPILWMVLSSLKPSEDLTATPPKLGFSPTFDHYRALFSGGNDIAPYIANSIFAKCSPKEPFWSLFSRDH